MLEKKLLSEAGKLLKLAESSLSILFLVINLKWDSYSFKCEKNGMIYIQFKMPWAIKLTKFLHLSPSRP